MPQTTVNISGGYASWFNSTMYGVMDVLDRKSTEDEILNMFGEITDGSKATTIDMTGRANDGYASVKNPGQRAVLTAPVQEDQMSKNFFTISERENVEYEAFVHDKYDFVREAASDLYDRAMSTFYLVLTHQMFNFSTSTSVSLPGGEVSYSLATPDGAALHSRSHTTPAGGTGISNLAWTSGDSGTGELSGPNLTTHISYFQQRQVTSKGNSLPYQPDILFVAGNEQSMVEIGKQITGSTLVASTNNNAISVYSGGRMKLVALNHAPYDQNGGYRTSKRYAWGTAKEDQLKKIMKYKWADRPNVLPKFADQENGDSSYLLLGRLGFGASRWQGTCLNDSATAPTTNG